MKTIRTKFEKDFGEKLARQIMSCAVSHNGGFMSNVSENLGSDEFKWALLQIISFECLSDENYRNFHKIKCSWPKVKKWIKENGHLESHDGDSDILGLLVGAYNEYMPKGKK